jgi:hypothetical protein
MPAKKNPLNLNALQLKTLTLLQELARSAANAETLPDGTVRVSQLPYPHGDHFHVGAALVMARDAHGLSNPAAWMALERKGLIKSEFPDAAVLTPTGLAYDTGLADQILHHGGH